MLQELIEIFDRDLERLKQEIVSFQDEKLLWVISGEVVNPAGNLCLHLVGNLNSYIGKNIGGYPYVRDREAEFKLKNVPKEKLIQQVEAVRSIVLTTLKRFDEENLQEEYVENVFGHPMSNSYFLIHLTAHFSYHLGQINYIRRMLA